MAWRSRGTESSPGRTVNRDEEQGRTSRPPYFAALELVDRAQDPADCAGSLAGDSSAGTLGFAPSQVVAKASSLLRWAAGHSAVAKIGDPMRTLG